MSPQLIIIRAIHTRAPMRERIRLLGTSKKKYPMKKMPAPSPYTLSLNPSADFIWSCAKPMLIRSRYDATCSTHKNGIRRRYTFRTVAYSKPGDSVAQYLRLRAIALALRSGAASPAVFIVPPQALDQAFHK